MITSIAHLSDPHITTGPLAAAPAQGLYRALGRVLTLDPQPDCVVITGDLVDRGSPEEYRALREGISRFPLPPPLGAGHPSHPQTPPPRVPRAAPPRGGAVDYPLLTVVVLDSKVPHAPGGRLGTSQLEWLDGILARRPETPAVVCVHHPPIAVGIPFLDGMRLDDGEDLAAVLRRHGNVARVLAGHVHRPVTAAFAGTVLATAPSTHLQSGLALRDGVPNYLPEPTSFLLHLLSGSAWVTHTVPVSHAAAAIAGF